MDLTGCMSVELPREVFMLRTSQFLFVTCVLSAVFCSMRMDFAIQCQYFSFYFVGFGFKFGPTDHLS